MLDYLERYVATFELPVRLGVKVDGLFREGRDSGSPPARRPSTPTT